MTEKQLPSPLSPLVVTKAEPLDMVGLRITRVADRAVDILGGAYVFGNDIEVCLAYPGGDRVDTLAILSDSLNRWWHIDAPCAFGYRLRFNRPSILATQGPVANNGAMDTPSENAVQVATSLGVTVIALDTGGSLGTAIANNLAYPRGINVTGVPGSLLGTFTKDKNVQLLAGGTTQLAIATPQPAYVHLKLGPTNGGSNYVTPLYLFFTAGDLPAGLDGACKMGDLMVYALNASNEFDFMCMINHEVDTLGLWVPANETASGGLNPYCSVRATVYGLANYRALPTGGGAVGFGVGGSGYAGGGGSKGGALQGSGFYAI